MGHLSVLDTAVLPLYPALHDIPLLPLRSIKRANLITAPIVRRNRLAHGPLRNPEPTLFIPAERAVPRSSKASREEKLVPGTRMPGQAQSTERSGPS